MNVSIVTGCERVVRRKIRIEFWDNQSAKHTLTIDGELTRQKVARILDYVELMGGSTPDPTTMRPPSIRKKVDRIWDLLVTQFKDRVFFVSGQVKAVYDEMYGEKIGQSTVATYLSRLSDRGLLIRTASAGEWRYALNLRPQSETHRLG